MPRGGVVRHAPLLAQKHPNIELGFNAERRYQFGDVDSVNLFNGNLIVHIPIAGAISTHADFKYQLTLIYNSKVWDYYDAPDTVNGGTYTTSPTLAMITPWFSIGYRICPDMISQNSAHSG